MSLSEGAAVTDAERQRIERELAELHALVAVVSPDTPLDFRAIHAAATRLTRAAYEGWKKAALAAIAPTPRPETVGKPAVRRGRGTARPP
jgi:hypothetical protein